MLDKLINRIGRRNNWLDWTVEYILVFLFGWLFTVEKDDEI